MTDGPIQKAQDEIFCRSCGRAIKREAVICPHCGVPVAVPTSIRSGPVPKDKTVAVLLAVFLGFWTWLYTYKRDMAKFWISLGVNIVGIFLLFIPNVAMYIWSIVDVAVKPQQYYLAYPNG